MLTTTPNISTFRTGRPLRTNLPAFWHSHNVQCVQKQKHKKETTGKNKRRPNKQSQRNVYIMPSDQKLYSLCQENAALKIIHPEHYELRALERMTLNPKPYKHQPLLGWGAETNFIRSRNRPARKFRTKKFQNSFVEWLLACGTWHVG